MSAQKKAYRTVHEWLQQKPKSPLLVVLGPTASGKTELSIEFARHFDGEIINADSRQIYREVELGTAKPTAAELRQVPHHLISEFSPERTVTVAEYRKLAEECIRDILKRGKLPILSGSHTLLISAIVENYRFPGKVNKKRRDELLEIYAELGGPQKLWCELRKLNPKTAERIPAENQHHLIRALERTGSGIKPQKDQRKFDCKLLGLNVPREKLYEKINARVDEMMRSGLLAEVEHLAKKYDRHSPALRGHGYRELLDYLNGEKDLERAVEEIKKDTRNYAKRQMTWFRNSAFAKEIIWI
ncbi:MAG: tRNA (adenosine(37)-N6)-dimethylallyltransferase MiaA [Patescibacteria group bacterium]